MRFEDLTDQQLKQVIKSYRLHLLEGMKGYTKFGRDKLIYVCSKIFDIDDEKIKPKVTEPIYFTFPQDKRKKRGQPQARVNYEREEDEQMEDYEMQSKQKELERIGKAMEKIEEKLKRDMIEKYGTYELHALASSQVPKYKQLRTAFKKKHNLKNKIQLDDFVGNMNFERQLQNNKEYMKLKEQYAQLYDEIDY